LTQIAAVSEQGDQISWQINHPKWSPIHFLKISAYLLLRKNAARKVWATPDFFVKTAKKSTGEDSPNLVTLSTTDLY
jgi:hypothetical protein